MATDPKAKARDAFADLPTPEKTAFVIEATFQTIGEALRETGQRLADVINEFDPESFFRGFEDDPDDTQEEAPSPAAKTAAAKKPAATQSAATKSAGGKKTTTRKTTTRKTTGTQKSAGKTAGRKKKDDDA